MDAVGEPDGAAQPDPFGTEPSNAFQVPWSPFDAIGAFLLSLAAGALGTALLASVGAAASMENALVQGIALPVSLAILALCTLLVTWLRARRDTWKLGGPLRPRLADAGVGLGLGLLAYLGINLVLGGLLEALAEFAGSELPTVQQTFREAARNPRVAPIFAFGAVVVAPAAEELFFRGMLFQSLRSRLGLWPGIGLSAVAFSFAHLAPGGDVQANLLVFVVIFPLGMALAYMFHRRGTLLVPVLAHMVFNSIGVAALMVLEA